MKRIKIASAIFLSSIILGSVYVYGDNITKTIQVTYRNISILVNGKQIQSEQEPFIYEGRTFAPLRTIAEAVNKNVEWDNEKSQVNITDKQNGYISLPFHKIGERIEVYPYALTVKKVYVDNKDKHGENVGKDYIFIDITLENISEDLEIDLDRNRTFMICDSSGKKLSFGYMHNIDNNHFDPHYNSMDDGYLLCVIDEKMKNNNLILGFFPSDYQVLPEAYIGFLAVDLGKIDLK